MKSNERTVTGIVVIVVLLIAGFFVAREWDQISDLFSTDDEVVEVDPLSLLATAVVERTNVVDIEELDARLNYVDRVVFAHRVDPDIEFITNTVGAGRGAQTVTTEIEVPGSRAITDLPDVGAFLSPGDVLYETDSTPVYLAQGVVAAWRTMSVDTEGTDVEQLEQHLVDGGWASEELEVDGEWTLETTDAVEDWQDDTGQEVTGEVALGDVWFVDGSIRIVEVVGTVGAPLTDRDSVLTYTSDDRRIEVSVAELPEGLLAADSVTVELPNRVEVPGTIGSVRGTAQGFDVVIDVDLEGVEVDTFDRLPATISWTLNELVDELTIPPEAVQRLDSGEYVVYVLTGEDVTRTPIEIIGQAGRVVAVRGVDERAQVLIP